MGSFFSCCGSKAIKRAMPEMEFRIDSDMKWYFFSTCCAKDNADIKICVNCSKKKDLLTELENKTIDKKIELNKNHSISKDNNAETETTQ
jgi:sulfur relay (sulfurtransferase) complex TusBCD TusD component (DsrE family)